MEKIKNLVLDQNNHYLNQFMDASPIPMRLIDTDYNIVKQNYEMARLARAENIGFEDSKCSDEFCGEYCHDERCTLKRILAGEGYIKERVTKYNTEGEKISCILTAIPYYDADSNILGVFEAFEDIRDVIKKEKKLKNLTEKLKQSVETTIYALASVVEKRDPYVAGHQKRVGNLAEAIGKEMGFNLNYCEGLKIMGTLHDIGKIQIPTDILNKPGQISAKEFELIKEHSRNGYELIKEIDFFQEWPVAEAVLQHHEKIDGSGYPQGLEGEDILISARILCVADVIEAMASHRPYRPALGVDIALKEVENKKGTKFDPEVVDACITLFRQRNYSLKGSNWS